MKRCLFGEVCTKCNRNFTNPIKGVKVRRCAEKSPRNSNENMCARRGSPAEMYGMLSSTVNPEGFLLISDFIKKY